MSSKLLVVGHPAHVEKHVMGSFSFRKIQVDPDGNLVLQSRRSEKPGVHIHHGNQVLFGKTLHEPESEQFPRLGTPLQVVEVINDTE